MNTPEALQKFAHFQDQIPEIAEKAYGVDRNTLAHLWQTQPIMRSAPFQRMMLDAMRYQQIKQNPPRPTRGQVPPVLKPSARFDHARYDTLAGLRKAVDADPGNVKLAARLLSESRRARARG